VNAKRLACWLVLGCALLWQGLAGAGSAPAIQELGEATLGIRDQQTRVTLPHTLARGQFAPSGERVTYRLTLTLAEKPTSPLAVSIVKASRSANIRVNGHALGSCAPGPLEGLRCAQAPLFMQAPDAVWQSGVNQIEVEVFANSMQTNGLSRVLVGPAQALFDERHQPAQFWRQDLVTAVSWATAAFGVLALFIGLRYASPQRRGFLWFGLACMLRATSNLYATSIAVHDDAFWVQWAFTAARLASIPVMILTLLSFFEHRLPRLERWLVIYGATLPFLVAATGARTDWAMLLSVPGTLIALYLIPVISAWVLAQRSRTAMLMLAALFALLACGLHDVWVLATPSGFDQPMALPIANGILLLTLGSIIIGRMAHALAVTANLNETLRDQVAAAESDLRQQHQKILEFERRHARNEEREQLLRDLHDGLGSNLASARILLDDQTLPPAQVRELIDDCIDDMRLLIDASGPQAQLADALGSLRYRITQRLGSAPVQVQWTLHLANLPPLPATSGLQLLRLVQEALTNALRHSGGKHIQVSARYDTDRLHLTVADNGQGLRAGAREGRGLGNMRQRAARVGASLQLHSDAAGTRVEVVLPIPQT
jgi:signal transduction histidine kinase